MSETPGPQIDLESPTPQGDVQRFARRRIGPGKVALAALLATLITAAAFAILSLVIWAITTLVH